MLTTIIVAIIVGAIVGALARLALPGNQNISLLVTIILGILGSIIGTWLLATLTGYSNASGGIAWIGLLGGVIVAAILIVIYGKVTGIRQV
jgi:uncharacterized membrane protein YeaQ/YmgE (transglycosylase-associated protein family)